MMMENITFSELDQEYFLFDQNYSKLFHLFQFNIEYLLFVQECIYSELMNNQEILQEMKQKMKNLKESSKNLKSQNEILKSSVYRSKRTILTYEYLLENKNKSIYEYLNSHILRRHSDLIIKEEEEEEDQKEKEKIINLKNLNQNQIKIFQNKPKISDQKYQEMKEEIEKKINQIILEKQNEILNQSLFIKNKKEFEIDLEKQNDEFEIINFQANEKSGNFLDNLEFFKKENEKNKMENFMMDSFQSIEEVDDDDFGSLTSSFIDLVNRKI
ncbi:zinc finger protein dzip1 [Anaeramoeba ignava]|uniref:Zinc finger protein dzip1 n=1 Tax=Anaeramoeba ignava TaxID=1746090 RepID=A0A9Q0L6N9_ANAIG|nr:zinc finger protein dzip1 [Anaeramoeba ignava]